MLSAYPAPFGYSSCSGVTFHLQEICLPKVESRNWLLQPPLHLGSAVRKWKRSMSWTSHPHSSGERCPTSHQMHPWDVDIERRPAGGGARYSQHWWGEWGICLQRRPWWKPRTMMGAALGLTCRGNLGVVPGSFNPKAWGALLVSLQGSREPLINYLTTSSG